MLTPILSTVYRKPVWRGWEFIQRRNQADGSAESGMLLAMFVLVVDVVCSSSLMHSCTNAYTHTDKHVDTRRCTQSGHTQTDTNKPMDTNTWKHTDTHGHTQVDTYRNIHIFTHSHTYYICTYVCTCILSKIDIDLVHLCRKPSSLLVTTVAFLF